MAEARNHHFVPQAYLRGFSNGIGRQAQVFVVDMERRKKFNTLVRNVASSRDFNRVDIEGHSPNVLEHAYGTFEDKMAPALRRICAARSLDNTEDAILLLNLVALLATRNPRFRKRYSGFIDAIYRKVAHITFSKKERWEGVKRRMENDGVVLREDLPFETLQSFALGDNYDIVVSTGHHAKMEITQFDKVIDVLAKRSWRLMLAQEGASDFVTSDHPVCLVRKDGMNMNTPIGYGLTGTVVYFPLDRRTTLAGEFSGPTETSLLGPQEVAHINTQVIQCAEAQVYAADDKFTFVVPPSGKLATGGQLLSTLAR